MSGLTARSGPRTLIGLLAALGLVGALAVPVLSASVTPEFYDITANKECDFFEGEGQTWTTLKVDPNPDGDGPFEYDDGTLFVTITNADDDKSFDWSSNIGVDAVYVKAGAGGSNLYRYDPPSEVTGDTDLVSPGESGNGISHISFCYDLPDNPPESIPAESIPAESIPAESIPAESIPAESIPAESIPAESVPASVPAESELPDEETAEPTESIREDELGGNPTATPGGDTLPDTAMGDWGQVPATVLSLLLLGSLAGMVYVRLARQR